MGKRKREQERRLGGGLWRDLRRKKEKGRGSQRRRVGGSIAQTRAGGQPRLGPRCGLHASTDALPVGSGPNGAWAGSLEDVSFLPLLSFLPGFSAGSEEPWECVSGNTGDFGLMGERGGRSNGYIQLGGSVESESREGRTGEGPAGPWEG